METGVIYRHRQVGWAIIIILGLLMAAIAVITALMAARLEQEGAGTVVMALSGLFILLAAIMACFCTLTVQIRDGKLTLWFGPGLIRKSLNLSAIESAREVTNKWWYGLGIHITPFGWLYNVSGLQAVEIHTWSGTSIRLGTDEPEALCRAIEHARTINPIE